jgi:hypothetical protein
MPADEVYLRALVKPLGLVVAALGIAAIVALLARTVPDHRALASSSYFRDFRRLTVDSGAIPLHSVTYASSGGRATIRWYDSSFEPTNGRRHGIASIHVDGARVASVTRGSSSAEPRLVSFQDGPIDLVWRGRLGEGEHRVEVLLEQGLAVGIPYTDEPKVGVDNLTITEDR